MSLKNAQQTTPGAHRKRNSVHIHYPYHPLTGQTVEVVRPYHSKEEQPYGDITLPDGTRAFVPASWTQGDEAHSPLFAQELDARAVLALAKLVAALRLSLRQRGASDDEHTASPLGAVSARASTAAAPGLRGSQSQTTSRASGEQP
jgi:hypothetical protein